MSKNSINNIVNKIKSEHISPDSKLKCEWKNYAYWSVLGVVSFFGALFFSLMLVNLTGVGSFYHLGLRKFIHFLVVMVPYFWIVLFVLAVTSGIISFRKTKFGYRSNTIFLVSSIVLIVSFLGILFHFSNAPRKLNDEIVRRAPEFQERFVLPKEERLINPEKGVVVGTVVKIRRGGFDIYTIQRDEWRIGFDRNTKMPKRDIINVGTRIIVIGEKRNGNLIQARAIKYFAPKLNQNQININR
jgi:hypothetical protein